MNRKRNQDLENRNIEDFEMRVADLEDQMSIFQAVMIPHSGKNIQPTRRIEIIE